VAVPLFAALRKQCTVTPAKRALDRILVDEVRHRDFGWDLLDHLLDQPYAPLVRETVDRELPAMFARLRRSYSPPGAEKSGRHFDESARAWGLMPTPEYASTLQKSVQKDHVPRFEKRGFDAKSAWRTVSPAAREKDEAR
jgi:hypothetical protein